MYLGEVAFVFRLQVFAPDNGEFKHASALQEDVHGLGIRDPGEGPFRDETQPLQEALVNVSIEEFEFIGTLFQGRLY